MNLLVMSFPTEALYVQFWIQVDHRANTKQFAELAKGEGSHEMRK